MHKQHMIGFGISLLSGLVIGGLIGMLYTPKTGEDTRRMIRDKAADGFDSVKEKTLGAFQGAKN